MPAALPQRSRRFGVGKEIGYAVYRHRDYEELFGEAVTWAKRYLPQRYEYTVVKLNQRNDSMSFIHCPGFDSEHEPLIEAIVVVRADGTVGRCTMPKDPYIYHHKWLFVADDYDGFDVEASKARSLAWVSLDDVDRSRIGRASYWDECVVPRLTGPLEETWVRSDQIRKALGISACQLSHLRNDGKLLFRKQGNAYLYFKDQGPLGDLQKG